MIAVSRNVPTAHVSARAWRLGRRGITLFEILLALGIFLAAVTAIGQIVNVGSTAATDGQLQSEAVLRCETKLAEIIAGIEPLAGAQTQAFTDDASWSWSLAIADGPHPDLLHLTVSVTHQRVNGSTDAQFVLTRLLRDPQLFIDAAAMQEVE
jgi:general secretion pathway protein I